MKSKNEKFKKMDSLEIEEQEKFWNRKFVSYEEAERKRGRTYSGDELELNLYFMSKEDMW
jgi:hypothetical protein